MYRKTYKELLQWKNEAKGKCAIMIDGARRVGKSYIAEEFGKNEYESYILIDFFTAPDEIKELFEKYLSDLDTLFMRVSAYYSVKLHERNTLFIFDEVQFFPRARAAIKYLVADGRYDFIETGSLLSIKKNTQDILIPSEERHLRMNPMDFEEFLLASGNETMFPLIKDCFEKKTPMGQALHRKAMDLFRLYLIVGGMQLKAEAIFDEIPAQLSKHEKKFKLASLKKDARMRDYDDAFMWLKDSRIVNICYNADEPNIALKMNMTRTTLKCYMADTGLLISHAFDENGLVSEEIYKKLLFGKLEVNEGMIFENIVAQMLTANGHKLYFYSQSDNEDSASRMEVDFLITKNKVTSRHNIQAIEVKSMQRYTLSSLNKFRTKYSEYAGTCYVLHTSDFKEDNGIIYLPVYFAALL